MAVQSTQWSTCPISWSGRQWVVTWLWSVSSRLHPAPWTSGWRVRASWSCPVKNTPFLTCVTRFSPWECLLLSIHSKKKTSENIAVSPRIRSGKSRVASTSMVRAMLQKNKCFVTKYWFGSTYSTKWNFFKWFFCFYQFCSRSSNSVHENMKKELVFLFSNMQFPFSFELIGTSIWMIARELQYAIMSNNQLYIFCSSFTESKPYNNAPSSHWKKANLEEIEYKDDEDSTTENESVNITMGAGNSDETQFPNAATASPQNSFSNSASCLQFLSSSSMFTSLVFLVFSIMFIVWNIISVDLLCNKVPCPVGSVERGFLSFNETLMIIANFCGFYLTLTLSNTLESVTTDQSDREPSDHSRLNQFICVPAGSLSGWIDGWRKNWW